MNTTSDPEVEAIIADIREAFRGVRRGGITLHEAEVIDEYGTDEARAEARKLDTDGRWDRVPDHHVEQCTTALCHVDLESWRYYIPAYMIWSIRHFRKSSSVVSDFTIYTFDPSDANEELYEYKMERFRTLTLEQCRSVCRFLRYMAKNGDWADDTVANDALRKHWGQFCSDDD